MKKFFATLLVILVLAAAAFFFGWANVGVPPDAYGVIRSKTHGVDPLPVKPGEFRWVWYRLIPTNVKTTVFRLNTVYREFTATQSLPSAKVFSAFYRIDGDFSWKINAVFSFSLRPESLIPLIAAHNINTQEELAVHERDIAGQIEVFIMRSIYFDREFEGQVEELIKNGESLQLTGKILNQFPYVKNFSFQVKSADIPDFALYRQIKSLYDDYVVAQKDYISGNMGEKAEDRVESYYRFEELEQYGALLTKYPVLLEYLALENGRR